MRVGLCRDSTPIKAGVNMKAVFWLGICGFNANISFTFQAVKTPSVHLTYLRFRLLCKFFGILGDK